MATAPVEATRHRDSSRMLLVNAQVELDRGDLLQASEKAWGALAHYVKAVAEERGWENNHHADIMRIAYALVNVADAPKRQRRRLRSARALHVNFYEDQDPPESVQEGINDVAKLLAALEAAEPRFPTTEPPRRLRPGNPPRAEVGMGMATAPVEATKHRDSSRMLLVNAQVELDRGDLLQASEKAWGALAHYVKAVAEERGWENSHHADIMRIAQALAAVADAPQHQRQRVLSARVLHVNVYEDELNSESVQGGTNSVTKLLAALEAAEPRFPTTEPPRRMFSGTVLATRRRPR